MLDAGMTWTAMQISPLDAQTLDNRRFQVADICRIFGVPPHLVGETDKSTSWGSGIEQMTIGFLLFTLEQWLTAIENELNIKLFEGTPFYAEFNRDALTAMDAKTQAELLASGIQNGWMKPNEARKLKNLPAEPGGDRLYVNSTLVPLEMAGAQKQPEPAAPDDPEPPAPDDTNGDGDGPPD
jgi:HK97 family phage portal protein